MVDLDSNPTKLIGGEGGPYPGKPDVNDARLADLLIQHCQRPVAKYFASYSGGVCRGPSSSWPSLNGDGACIHPSSSDPLSAVIFNALIIVFLIPLALKGVSYHPLSALGDAAPTRRSLWILRPRRSAGATLYRY